ncbi:hypothetical protein [Clostridium sp. JNZ J1-5]
MKEDIPSLYKDLEIGDLSKVFKWLKENIHKHGAVYKPVEIIRRVTGEELQAKYFIEYLNDKFKKIYNI